MKKRFLFVPVLLAAHLTFSANANAKFLDGVRVVVQDRPILFSDVTNRVEAVKSSPALASIFGVSATTFNEQAALNSLIEEKIVLVSAKEIGAEPSETEVNKQIGVVATQNKLSVDNLKKSLRNEKIDFDLYKNHITFQLAKRAIVEKELRSSSSGQSDQELQAYYDKNMPEEVLLSMIKGPASKAGLAKLAALKSQLSKSPKSSESALQKNGAVDLGWTDPSGLNEAFQAALARSGKSASATAPFSWNGNSYLLVVRGRKKGDGASFESAKDEIRQRLQAKDVEERFKAWLEQKKKNLNIVVNKA